MGSSLPPGKQNFFLGFLWMILPKWFLFYYYIFKQYGFVFIYHPGQTKFRDVTYFITILLFTLLLFFALTLSDDTF